MSVVVVDVMIDVISTTRRKINVDAGVSESVEVCLKLWDILPTHIYSPPC